MCFRRALAATAFMVAYQPLTASAGPSADWPVYENVLHHYRVCYPARLLVPQGETDNSAGQTFLARSGARLDLYAYYQADKAPLAQELETSAATSAGQGGRITYRTKRANWGTVSGINGAGTVFYIKMLRQRDRIVKLEMRYLVSMTPQYRPVIERIERCFALTGCGCGGAPLPYRSAGLLKVNRLSSSCSINSPWGI
jgi:hypothetical protein